VEDLEEDEEDGNSDGGLEGWSVGKYDCITDKINLRRLQD
jgi:hypothetical protein